MADRTASREKPGDDSQSKASNVSDDRTAPSEEPDADSQGVYTVSEAIDSMGFGWFQVKISVFTGVIWMADAMMVQLLAVIGPAAKCQFGLSNIEVALITSSMLTGIFIGSMPYGWMMDRYGRQRILMFSAFAVSIFMITVGFAPSYGWLLFFVFMAGLNLSSAPQAITYYAEFLPSATRSRSIVCVEVFFSIGMMLQVAISMGVMPWLGWRYVPLFSALPAFLVLPFFAFMPRSPIFLVAVGNFEAARRSLELVAKANGTSVPPGRLVSKKFSNSAACNSVQCPDGSDQPLLESARVNGEADYTLLPAAKSSRAGVFTSLFKPRKMALTTLLLWEMWAVLEFAYFGLVLLTAEVLQGNLVVNGSCVDELSLAKHDCQLSNSDYVQVIWTTTAEIPGLLITLIFLEKIGRRRTLFVEFLGATICWLLLVLFCDVPQGVMLVFIFGARMLVTGAFQAIYVYTPEIYPTRSRALGMGLCNGMGRIGAISTPFVAQVVFEESVFSGKLIYLLTTAVATVSSLLLPYETSGKAMG